MKRWWEMRVLLGLAMAVVGAVGLAVLAYVGRTGATLPDGTPLLHTVISGPFYGGYLSFSGLALSCTPAPSVGSSKPETVGLDKSSPGMTLVGFSTGE